MKFAIKIMGCICGLSIVSSYATAQRKLPCPKPGKQRNYYAPRLINYSQANGFILYPVAYKYEEGFDRTYVRPASSIGFAVNVQNYLVLSERVELFVDAMYAITEHGVKFRYQNSGATGSGKDYVISTQYRFSLGPALHVDSRWTVAVAPSAVYNTMAGFSSTTYSSTNGSGSTSVNARWNNVKSKEWYAGASFYARWHAWKRAYVSLISAIDFASSAHQEGTMSVYTNGSLQDHTVRKRPYLLHVGLGIGFRFLEVQRRGYL